MNPHKASAIEDEIEKLLKFGFIYLVPLTERVSNSVHIYKKQGTIHVCTDFRELNRACLKDNFPHHSLIIFWMSVRGVRFSLLWKNFRCIIKSILNPRINIRLYLYVHRVHSQTRKCLSTLKMSELLFSGPSPSPFMTLNVLFKFI